MSVLGEMEQAAIDTLVLIKGNGSEFARLCAAIKRVEEEMPHATGKERFEKVVAEAEIFFDDLVVPLLKRELNLLIELGVAYITAQNPIVGGIAEAVVGQVEQVIENK